MPAISEKFIGVRMGVIRGVRCVRHTGLVVVDIDPGRNA
jgi:hypothetical protein